jgi:tetratricopeptide (TPR) repeat protein
LSKKAKRASIGVALIARDAEDTIGKCLDSFRKYVSQVVVCVDELSADRTAKLAKSHGADLVVPVKVSEWHECKDHGRVLVQHFAEARNHSFQYLDPSLDWWMWVDADDVLEGAEKLLEICDELKNTDAIGAWFPYDYGNVEGRVSTLFHRERLLRSSVGWRWRYRVHEVVEPVQQQAGGWQIRDDVRLVHQDHPRSESSAERNLRLLELDLEDAPNDARTLFYMGNQYFAMQDHQAAAYWYERLLEVDQNPYQRWQSAIYLSMSYQRMGDVDRAERAAFQAVGVMPQHPEPYYQLAVCARMRGDNERCIYWTKEARTDKVVPPFFVFKNPLDYSFNHRMVLADALATLGRIPEARAELEQAHAALPVESVKTSIDRYERLEKWAELAQAYTTLAQTMPDDAKIALWEALQFPPEICQFGRARDIVMPAYLRQRPNTQPRIVFWCGRVAEEWSPESINTTGIGGSETAVIEIAKRFAATGWRVDVYNGAGRYEGVYDDVGYWEPERFGSGEQASVLVSWRQPQFRAVTPRLRSVLWCHDLNYGPLPEGNDGDVEGARRQPVARGLPEPRLWHRG